METGLMVAPAMSIDQVIERRNQMVDYVRKAMQETFKGLFPMNRLEDMGKQNMALFENAMKMQISWS